MTTDSTLMEEAAALKDTLVKDRRHIHAHPELSYNEEQTAAYVARRLEEMNIPFRTGIGGHGVVAILGADNHGPVVALRADMDALPIQEENKAPYASKNDGVMHACGHDAHTACLLGAARLLRDREKDLRGTVKLIFQPAEERLPGGASIMVEEGVLEDPDVEIIIGQHVFPDMEVGHVGFRSGMYMASSDEVYVTIKGKGGHGGLPHFAVDPVLITAHWITAAQQLVSRRAFAGIPTVVSFGRVEALGATNIIPDKVKIQGTIRTMDEKWREELHGLLRDLTTGMAESMGGSAEIEIRKGYPVLVNDDRVTKRARAVAENLLGSDKVHDLDIRMASEDFAYYAQRVPACFYRIGTGNAAKKIGAPLHTSLFDIDEDALVVGAALMAAIAEDALKAEG
ncbi:MAG TPA: M20 family metallopeptidase [Cryomorphaceae bacterium]|nr:M20 family metallopeptidase [Cryomorphaceae bacterium]